MTRNDSAVATMGYGVPAPMALGDYVRKDSGDYTYEGWVVGVIHKRSGAVRYVVENSTGMLSIFNDKQLKRMQG